MKTRVMMKSWSKTIKFLSKESKTFVMVERQPRCSLKARIVPTKHTSNLVVSLRREMLRRWHSSRQVVIIWSSQVMSTSPKRDRVINLRPASTNLLLTSSSTQRCLIHARRIKLSSHSQELSLMVRSWTKDQVQLAKRTTVFYLECLLRRRNDL